MTHLNVGHKRGVGSMISCIFLFECASIIVVKTCWERSTNKVILEALNFSYFKQIHDVSLQYKLAEEYMHNCFECFVFKKEQKNTVL